MKELKMFMFMVINDWIVRKTCVNVSGHCIPLYPLKTPENQIFFQGVKMRPSAANGLNCFGHVIYRQNNNQILSIL